MPFTLSTIYKAVDKYSPIMKKMQNATTSFAQRQNAAFRKMRTTIGNVKNQLIGLAGGLSLASVMFIGANAVTNYDQALQSLSAITGVTGKQFDSFKKKSIEVAEDVHQSSVDVLKAFELVGSAKPELLSSADALGEVSKQALILSKAGKLLPEDSVNALTISLNQFGAGAEKAAEFVDILATAQQKGSGAIQYLSEAIVRSGGTMRAFNNSFEDTVAILEGYAKAGVPAAEAGTMLAGIMAKLVKAPKQFNPQYTKATDIINNLAKANLSYSDLIKLTDARGAKWLTQIINQNDIVQKLTGNLNDVGNAQRQMATQTASFSERIKQLRARFENLIIKGNETSGALNRLGKVIGFITKHLDKILTVVGLTIAAFTTYYTLMTTLRIATIAYNIALGIFYATQSAVPISLAASATAMKAYAVAQKIGTAATWLFNTALYANPIVWIVAAIIAAIAAITILVIKWKEITAWWEKSSVAIKILLSPLLIANAALIGIAFVIRKVIDNWKGLKKAFQEGGFLKGIKAVGKLIFSKILKPIELILKALGKIPGLGFAKRGGEMLAKFRETLEPEKTEKETKPVNVQKASNEAITSRYEEITREKLEIELNNRTDKLANLKKVPKLIPVTTNTF